MTTFERILVLLDRPAQSSALPAAATIAEKTRGTIRLLLHESRWSSDALDSSPHTLKREAEKLLSHRLHGKMEGRVTTVIHEGDPENAIATEIQEWNPDLMVVNGGRWEQKEARVALLKICVAHCHRPILALPGSAPSGDPLAVRRVVVALDGSALAEAGIERAVAFSQLLGVPLCLARVVPHAAPENTRWADAPKSLDRRMVEREEAHSYLLRVAARLRRNEIHAWVEIEADADPVRGLLALAAGSLLVITSHAREGLARIVFGSIAMEIVSHLTGPVLVVPPPTRSPIAPPPGGERSAASGTPTRP